MRPEFSEPSGQDVAIVFGSGGGTRGTDQALNRDYRPGLQLILERIGRTGLQIASIELASTGSQAAKLSAEERRVKLSEAYPILVTNAEALRKEIGRQVAAMGRRPGAKGGGNADKRVRIVVEGPNLSATRVAGILAGDVPNDQ